MTYILGLNAYHGDSSACLLKNGRLIAAAEEERFRRIKHWAGFPSEAIRYCLQEAGIGIEHVDCIGINSDPRACFWKKVRYTLSGRARFSLVVEKIRTRTRRASVEERLKEVFPAGQFSGTVYKVEHHLAHLASCFYVSPFDQAVALSIDGFGDFSSAAWGTGNGANLEVTGRIYFPHSLGVFYQAMTQYLGFPHYGDEYKVMGLAPYGKPEFMEEMRQLVQLHGDGSFKLGLEYFRHQSNAIGYEWADSAPMVDRLYSERLIDLLGPARKKVERLTQHHKNISRSIQVMYEEAFFHLLNKLHIRYGNHSLALAGGCAMNSVANGKIYRHTPFRKVYVQAAAGDAGGAIGAALIAWQCVARDQRGQPMDHAYWGPRYDESYISEILELRREELTSPNCSLQYIASEEALCQKTARVIVEGKVVGWFQGRMEWGPRALGNRSIVCDPRRADMKDILNRKIKRRESFRPFAPSILREAVSEWFETDDDVPFMMKVFRIRAAKRKRIPAVTHVDGSGRLQTVFKQTNPLYYRLIDEFRKLTEVPILLNTSFNENEPVVCRPEEALDCFLRTKMDVLVIGNNYIERL